MSEIEFNTVYRPMLVEMPIKIHGYDIDVMGIVNNIVYVRWFEELRNCFLDSFLPYDEIFERGISPMLKRTDVEYMGFLTMKDRPLGRIWMLEIGKTKWKAGFEIVTGDRVNCRGIQEGLFFNLESKRPARIPAELSVQYHKAVEGLRAVHLV